MAVHEGLHQQPAVALGCVEGALDLIGSPVHRLFAEHVLPRLERADRPIDVHGVGQRVVDDLDVVVCEQRLVSPVRALEAAVPCVLLGTGLVSARNRDDVGAVALPRAREDRLVDPGRREQAPAHRVAHPGDTAVPVAADRKSASIARA